MSNVDVCPDRLVELRVHDTGTDNPDGSPKWRLRITVQRGANVAVTTTTGERDRILRDAYSVARDWGWSP